MAPLGNYEVPFLKKKGRPLSEKEFEEAAAEILRDMGAATKPFEEDNEEEKQKRRERAAKDYEYFCLTYLPHYFNKPFGEIHRELISYCETGGKSLNAVAYPREHGKSAIASFAKPLQMALCDISPYSIILSDTSELAQEMIQWIKLECEENQRIKQDFGDPKTEGWWEKDDIVLFGTNRIRGMGHAQKVRGTRFKQHRPFFIVIDDLENDINVKNKQLVKEKVNWILGAVYGSLDDNGTLLMVGTMLDKDSVLSRLVKIIQEKAEEFKTQFHIKGMNAAVYSAIIDENTPNERPCWPEGKTLEGLKQIRFVVGPIIWASEFQNKPLDCGLYKLEWIQFYDRQILVGKMWQYYSGSDPSVGESEQSDFKAHVVVALDAETKKRYVVEAWIRREVMNEFFRMYIELYQAYKMSQSAFEVNGYQINLATELTLICRNADIWPNIMKVHHSTDKVARISQYAGMVARGDCLFSKGYSDIDILTAQLNALGTRDHDDGADAWEMAITASMNRVDDFIFKASGSTRASARLLVEGYYKSNSRATAYVRGLL